MKGIFCRAKSRILAFIFSLRASSFYAQAGGFECAACTASGVVVVLFADGDEADLHGREPEREGAGVVLDEDAEEALDGAEEGAVDHDGLVRLAVFADVFELEAGGEVEVELHGGELPEAAEDVDELDVDLGAVEGGFAGDGLVGNALAVEHARERADGVVPLLGAADELLGRRGPRWRARL